MAFEKVLMHLRKSRADIEAEARGEGETLEKHEKLLWKFARENNINVVDVRRELESGESLIHRPKMLLTLQEVQEGLYDGVLCIDIDRLGRGDMQDQGLILKTFKNTGTKIITPRKVYDLNDEWDEEYTEFETFMARKELKLINRRLQRGRIGSVDEGNYLGTRPPFGYLIHKEGKKNRYLVPHPDQAPVVKIIFEWYTHQDPEQRMGSKKIANALNEMGLTSYTGKTWEGSSVLNIIKNPVYIGRIVWKKKEIKKSTLPGKKKDTRTRPRDEWIDVPGKHEPLVSEEVFNRAQEIISNKYHVPFHLVNGITNPLAGLIKCDYCGASMVKRPYNHQQYPHLICHRKGCPNKSSRFEYVESKVIQGLTDWLEAYKNQWLSHKETSATTPNVSLEVKIKALQSLQKELAELEKQKSNLHDLLERGVYTVDIYLERSQEIARRLEETRTAVDKTNQAIQLEAKRLQAETDIIPKIEMVLEAYFDTDDPGEQNNLLKSVLDYATYRKEKHQRDDDFTLVLHPKIPS